MSEISLKLSAGELPCDFWVTGYIEHDDGVRLPIRHRFTRGDGMSVHEAGVHAVNKFMEALPYADRHPS